jgi:hypothetical protein
MSALEARVRDAVLAGRGPDLLAALPVRELLDTADVPALAARSYRHVLGFDKIILASARPHGQLRLHVWWPEEARRREHVHNHRFAFSSVVLAGRLRTSLYAEDPAGAPATRYRETSDPVDRRWRFEAVGTTRLATVLSADQPAGTAYTMSPALLHRIDAAPVLTVTLFLETRSVRESSDVYAEAGAEPPAPADQSAFDPADLAARLARLRTALG